MYVFYILGQTIIFNSFCQKIIVSSYFFREAAKKSSSLNGRAVLFLIILQKNKGLSSAEDIIVNLRGPQTDI